MTQTFFYIDFFYFNKKIEDVQKAASKILDIESNQGIIAFLTTEGFNVYTFSQEMNINGKINAEMTRVNIDYEFNLKCNYARITNENNLLVVERGTNTLYNISNCGLGSVVDRHKGFEESVYGKKK